jgi:hypothetical protein
MQVSVAQDLHLSFNDVIVYGDNSSFDPATGKITFGNNWSPVVGWEFSTPISKDKYPYLKLVFAGKNKANLIEIKTKNVDGSETSMGISKELTAFILTLEKDVESIYFQSSNWENYPSEPPFPTLTLVSATFLAPFATEKVPLPLNSNVRGEWWGGYLDVETSTIHLVNNWEAVVWNFEDPGVEGFDEEWLDANVYTGVGFRFEPLGFQRVDFRVSTYEGAHIFKGLEVGSESVEVIFAEDVYKLGFQYSNYDPPVVQDEPFIKIKEAYLLKKVLTGWKKINADTGTVDVYTILGIKVRSKVEAADALKGLEKGIYIVGGKKVCVTE